MPVGAALLLASALSAGTVSPADSAWAHRRHLLITEFGVSAVLTEPASVSAQYALGDLRRIDDDTFLGGEAAVDVHGYHEHLGVLVSLRPRVRREIGKGWAVDLAAGPIVLGTEHSEPIDGLGFSAATGVAYRGKFGLRIEVASRRVDEKLGGERLTTTQVGLRLGGGAGVLTGIGFLVLYTILGGLAADLQP
jgi:hypothetical protein